MKLFSENIEDLRTLYIANLKKALDMEQKITKALPTMIEKVNRPPTRHRLPQSPHRNPGSRRQGRDHPPRRQHGEADTSTCKAISALVTEAEDNIKDAADTSIRDITLIASAQQVEHHEIAVYGTLRTWAELLGEDEAADILDSILDEEKNADELLSTISDRVNTAAANTVTAVTTNA